MKKFFYFLAVACFVVILGAVIFQGSRTSLRSPANSAIVEKLEPYLKFIPDEGLKRALQQYLQEASGTYYGANEGIQDANFELIEKNKCVAELAADFYARLSYLDGKYLPQVLGESFVQRPIDDKAALSDELGTGIWKDVPPGIVWELAKQVSGGDPNLAVALIGICGHDDSINFSPLIKDPEIVEKYKTKTLLGWRQKMKIYEPKLNDNQEQAYDLEFKELQKKEGLRLTCPRLSLLYIAKSLGKDVDISEDLKKHLTRIQAPNKGRESLPSKYYHVMAGMRTGCLVKQESGYLLAGPLLARHSTRIYRGIRLRGKFIGRDQSRQDAYRLWQKWYKPLVLPGLGEVWLPSPHRRPENNPRNLAKHWLNPNPPSREELKDCEEPSWSKERCLAALSVLDTWEIDFTWTSEQHWIGAKFGESACEQFSPGETLETRACEALRKRQ